MMFMAMMMAIAFNANAMSYNKAKKEALFLSDKMAYELNLSNAQYDAVYEINLDYLMSVNGRNDGYGYAWDRRNTDLQYILTAYQYNKYMVQGYFYRPLDWKNGNWTFNVYKHYNNKNYYYKGQPKNYATYKGKPKGKDGHMDVHKNDNRNDHKNVHNPAQKDNHKPAKVERVGYKTQVKAGRR